ncbi:peptidoglycan-binding domain-containing protein [Aequorivita sp. SDUM287046]|uniref:Peptidoglycan-binding domain-containing protein n=1 Tax=Aequorivita aurantiaca TaxID=3053356 RepID=A0ABT8DE57_9FLAO|nr:peptidoglycan-binding domain-containing protein [Aequorivita aurantiaca]MDN3723572.1 peptidoglycan-binding domain-containing protein [Aequorivita aurantiaca]
MGTLFLGSCDLGKTPIDRKKYLAPYHKDGLTTSAVSFRDDDRTSWRSFRQENGNDVFQLQQFLYKAGFMPRGVVDGVFDYVTQSAARLFQEYIRTIDPEGDPQMVPDGIVGNGTMKHIQRWKNNGITAEWGSVSSEKPSKEFSDWIKLLNTSKEHYQRNSGPIMKAVNELSKTYSTLKVKDWNFSPDEIHLIGIRRNQEKAEAVKRANDDLFVLLVNGMVFKFWGSTDPSKGMVSKNIPPSLVEGQHKYRFGWHKISEEQKIYRALKPYDPAGVIILRDLDRNNALTPQDLALKGSNSLEVNNSINIHWSGIGSSNWSAGCQVIAGKNYINNQNKLVDCSAFASAAYGDLNATSKKTKGAYNVLADLIVCYSKPGVDYVLYSLGRAESLNLNANFGADYATNALKKMNPNAD